MNNILIFIFFTITNFNLNNPLDNFVKQNSNCTPSCSGSYDHPFPNIISAIDNVLKMEKRPENFTIQLISDFNIIQIEDFKILAIYLIIQLI